MLNRYRFRMRIASYVSVRTAGQSRAKKGGRALLPCCAAAVLAGCVSHSQYLEAPVPLVAGVALTPQSPEECATLDGSVELAGPEEAYSDPVQSAGRLARQLDRWFKSGRGWTWGAARHGPVRDLALDRLMLQTLISSEPRHSGELDSSPRRLPANAWLYP